MTLRRTTQVQGPPGPPGAVHGVPTSWTPGAIASGAFVSLDVSVPGALTGYPAWAAWSALLPDGVTLTAQVKAAGTVRCTMLNLSGAPQTIAAGVVYPEALIQ